MLTLAASRAVKALFKPRVEGDCEGWHRVPIEVAAYQVTACAKWGDR